MLRRAAGDAWGKKSGRDVARKEKAKVRIGAGKGMIKGILMRKVSEISRVMFELPKSRPRRVGAQDLEGAI